MLHRQLTLPETTLNPFALEKGGAPGWISLLCFVVYTETYIVLHIFSLLTSLEPVLMPNGSLLHFHSNDMNCVSRERERKEEQI